MFFKVLSWGLAVFVYKRKLYKFIIHILMIILFFSNVAAENRVLTYEDKDWVSRSSHPDVVLATNFDNE